MSFVRNFPVVAGYGVTKSGALANSEQQFLLQIQLPVVDNDECTRLYRNIIDIQPSHLCAGFLRGGKGTCQGDAGGPLMWLRNGTSYMIGMVSFGNRKCGEPGYPDVFPRITSYIDWIEENIK